MKQKFNMIHAVIKPDGLGPCEYIRETPVMGNSNDILQLEMY
jgi:hypothetical protein